jgi:hypothetical protein
MSPEPVLASLASEVEGARDSLLNAARRKPTYPWSADELVKAARGNWRETVVMIALDQLLEQGLLHADSEWRVRVRT